MTSDREPSEHSGAVASQPRYTDIQRWTDGYPAQCDGCTRTPHFVLTDDAGHYLVQCESCLVETFSKDAELMARILRAVAQRL